MNDLISRQAAIDAMLNDRVEITDFIKALGKEREFEILNATCDRHAKMLEELPSAAQWIPVSERLPSSPGLYLVTCNTYDVNGRTPVGITTSAAHWHKDKWLLEGVIAWAELPSPYKEES